MGNYRRIQSIDPKTGKVVKVYDSLSAAARDLKARTVSQIYLALKYEWKTAHGFKWADVKVPAPGITAKRMSRKEVVKFIIKKQDVMTYAQLSAHTGLSVDELREIYDEEKLYKSTGRTGGRNKYGN